MYNLRPYDQPVATAITLVGMIYMLIFSFIIAMMNNSAREIMQVYLPLLFPPHLLTDKCCRSPINSSASCRALPSPTGELNKAVIQ